MAFENIGHFEGTQYDYYYGNNHGNYQFIPLEEIIANFQVMFIGEDKIISKYKRADVAYYAQRALSELSFDTFKSVKSQQIEIPPSLQMILPHDYVNYTRLTWVDSSGIEHPLYRTNGTSNPFQIRQHADGTYDFPESFELVLNNDFSSSTADSSYLSSGLNNGKLKPDNWITSNSTVFGATGAGNSGGSDVTVDASVLSFNHSSHDNDIYQTGQISPHGKAMACWQLIDVSDLEFITLSANGVSKAADGINSANIQFPITITGGATPAYPAAQGNVPGAAVVTYTSPATTLRFGISTSPGDLNTFPDVFDPAVFAGPYSQNQHTDLFDVPHVGSTAYVEWTAGQTGVKTLEMINVSQYDQVYVLITSYVPWEAHATDAWPETLLMNNTIDDVTVKNALPVTSLQSAQGNSSPNNSSTWDAFKSLSQLESADYDYDDAAFHPAAGERYGLDPQHAQANGSFYIDERLGKIHFSSNISGKNVILDYISDSLGTESEMQVHKLAEDAMYKFMLYDVMMSLRGVGRGQLAMYKKEKFAAVRKAKLRLSNIKLEEITQILRGKSKWIKH